MADATKLPYRPCVGLMVMNRDGLVWIGRRPEAEASPEGPGSWWQMPQGGIDEGEDVRRAGLRELMEETGMRTVEIVAEHPDWVRYELPPSLVGKAWGGRFRGQKQKWLLLRLTGADDEIDIGPRDGFEVEFDQWKWVPATELVGLIVPFKREVYREVVGHFLPLVRPLAATRR
jgi:putative (di)nucleoside polyphosphate hydrolase